MSIKSASLLSVAFAVMERTFKNFSISLRIASLVGLALAGLTVISITYFAGNAALNAAEAQRSEAETLLVLVGDIESGALRMRRREKDFLLRMDETYLAKYEKDAERVANALTQVQGLAIAGDLEAPLAKLRETLPAHRAKMAEVGALYKEVGLSEELGLSGTLRKAVHEVEEKLDAANLDALTVKMLMMRRHEKDFMLRGDDKYIDRVDERRKEFDSLIQSSSLFPAERKRISALMDTYQQSFKAYAAAVKKAEAGVAELSDIYAVMEPEFDALFAMGRELSEKAIEDGHSVQSTVSSLMIAVLSLTVLGVALSSLFVAVGISRPINKITGAMSKLAEGDKSIAIPALDRGDEIGAMAKAMEVFKQNAIEAERLALEQAEEQKKRAERAEIIQKISASFEGSVKQVLENLAGSVTIMRSSSGELTALAGETSRKSGDVTHAADAAAANVQMVASATEELSSSISEISRQVTSTRDISAQAITRAESAAETVTRLSEAAQQINDVVTMINDIANQTNLLALNATIEAARAGEAGKGFAVVASEVKTLAGQTAKATEGITGQIAAMQEATSATVEAIKHITDIITEIGQGTTGVASAIEEQTAATQEISRNVQEVANGVQGVTDNMADVNTATQETGTAAQNVSSAAEDVSGQSTILDTEVKDFLSKLAAA